LFTRQGETSAGDHQPDLLISDRMAVHPLKQFIYRNELPANVMVWQKCREKGKRNRLHSTPANKITRYSDFSPERTCPPACPPQGCEGGSGVLPEANSRNLNSNREILH